MHVPEVPEPDDDLGAAFRAGRHQEVLERAWDGPSATRSIEHAPYIAGSLALLGRLDEALAFITKVGLDPATPAPIAIETRFFAVVGLCHTGRYAEAATWVARNTSCDEVGPRSRFFVHQGSALLHYFTGRLSGARRESKQALEQAVIAELAYGRLLALDLRGHVLVQGGEIRAGLRVLEQASVLARALGSGGHAVAIECARLAYQNRHGRSGDLEDELSRVAATSVDNLYAHRAAWLELAFRGALMGEATRAREALERAAEHALPESDYRARARYYITHAFLSRIDRSLDETRAALDNARRALTEGDDRILFAELALWDRFLGGGAVELDAAIARDLASATDSLVGRVLVAMVDGRSLELADREESPLWDLITSPASTATRLETAVARGWLGLVAPLAGHAPGRHLVFSGERMLIDDRGDVHCVDKLPGHARELLVALRGGERTKEELVADVWRVPRYAPQLHDAVVHTAIARLRRALGPAADWIRTTPVGYALAESVRLVSVEAPATQAEVAERTIETPAKELAERILDALDRGTDRVPELADALGVSSATVLRRLRELTAEGRAVREGAGKSTRYRPLGRRPGR